MKWFRLGGVVLMAFCCGVEVAKHNWGWAAFDALVLALWSVRLILTVDRWPSVWWSESMSTTNYPWYRGEDGQMHFKPGPSRHRQ